MVPLGPRPGLTHRGITEVEFTPQAVPGRGCGPSVSPRRLAAQPSPLPDLGIFPPNDHLPSPRGKQGVCFLFQWMRSSGRVRSLLPCPPVLSVTPPQGAPRVRASPTRWQVSTPHTPLSQSNSRCVDGPHRLTHPPVQPRPGVISLAAPVNAAAGNSVGELSGRGLEWPLLDWVARPCRKGPAGHRGTCPLAVHDCSGPPNVLPCWPPGRVTLRAAGGLSLWG